jgi:hypothetical protein
MKQNTFNFRLMLLAFALALILLNSCANGYGCHGRSKSMTGTSHRFNK